MRRREFQPILLENLRIRWPGFAVRRVALNQHMPRVERLGEHVHRFAQILVYLRGEGVQHLGGDVVPVGRGTVLVIAPGRPHRFEKTRSVRPICLAVDFETREAIPWRGAARLSARDLARLERRLLALHELQRRPDFLSIQHAALVLRVLSLLEEALSGRSRDLAGSGPATAAVGAVIRREGLAGLTPGRIARSLGRSLDHLNRQVRSESGTTTGGLLDRFRLEEATRALRSSDRSVGDVAAAAGIDDQNYFARWFRRQTGQTPTRWRTAMRK